MVRKNQKPDAALSFVVWLSVAIGLLASASALAQVRWCSGMVAFEEMTKEGLKVMFHQSLDCQRNALPMSGASRRSNGFTYASNIVSEVGAPSFRTLLSAGNDGRVTEIPECRLFAVARSSSIDLRVAFREDNAAAERAVWKLKHYTSCRLEGHSVEYATDAMREFQADQVAEDSENSKEAPARRVLVSKEEIARTFHVPLKRLQQSTNDLAYFVVDGPVAWVYGGSAFRKHDARELDPVFASKLDQVREEVKKAGRKPPRDYYDEIWKLMKQRHNVEWLGPLDLNPGVNIGF